MLKSRCLGLRSDLEFCLLCDSFFQDETYIDQVSTIIDTRGSWTKDTSPDPGKLPLMFPFEETLAHPSIKIFTTANEKADS